MSTKCPLLIRQGLSLNNQETHWSGEIGNLEPQDNSDGFNATMSHPRSMLGSYSKVITEIR